MHRAVPAIYDIAIIGGGASGLAAAITSARAGAHVLVIERDVEAGLPLLATGNGRCNLSNENLGSAHYLHPSIASRVMGSAPERDIADFFASLGLITTPIDSRLYPITRRAESVRDVLLDGCACEGVDMECACTLTAAQYDEAARVWSLECQCPARPLKAKAGADAKASLRNLRRSLRDTEMTSVTFQASTVIIAVGGKSSSIAGIFSLPHLSTSPVLCPLAATPHDIAGLPLDNGALKTLDGQRVPATLSLPDCGWMKTGEVLFRPYGISGIVAFNASRRVHAGDILEMDLLPELSNDVLRSELERRASAHGALSPHDLGWFDGLLTRPVASFVTAVAQEPTNLENIEHAIKHAPFVVSSTADEQSAQVYRGGIPFDIVNLATLGINLPQTPQLFACGEALDMDADCGGFNLAWAWLSGIRAGKAAAHAAQETR